MGALLSNAQGSGAQGVIVMVIYIVVIVAFFYFMMVKPQKKEQQKLNNMLATLAIGDSVLTTSGFYGVIIDIDPDGDTVIVEFGGNKHCRIPMNKTAIAQIEKPDAQ